MKPITELITRAEVLAGKKQITLLDKVGEPMEMTLTAMPRSKLMELMRKHQEDLPERVLLACLGEKAEYLEQLDFDSQMEAQRIAAALCQGLPSAKNMQGAIEKATAALMAPSTGIAPNAS